MESAVINRVRDALPARPARFAAQWWAVISGRRVSGLAAEAAFWAVFSLPWLMLAFVAALGVAGQFVGDQVVGEIEQFIQEGVEQVLTPEAAAQYATPVLNDIFGNGRAELGVIGIVFAVWAGSRAVMTYVEAITVINGEFGHRGYFRARGLSMVLYLSGATLCIAMIPVVFVGPQKLGEWAGLAPAVVSWAYIILGLVVAMLLLTSLFHFSAFSRMPWRSSMPGAALALVVAAVATIGLTVYVRRLFQANSVYGVLATPIAVMIFAYGLSLIALMGAAFNAIWNNRHAAVPVGAPQDESDRAVDDLSSR